MAKPLTLQKESSDARRGSPFIGRFARQVSAGAMGVAMAMAVSSAGAQTITVDVSNSVSGNPRFWSECVGTGTASLTLRGDLQTHYKLANRELGMQRVRGHGLLNDDVGIFSWSGSGEPTYDWTNFDTYLAAIVAADMRPIIELSFMPKDLATEGSPINPPSDFDVYADLIEAVVQRAVDLYGEEEVSQWYWEVWNEPNYEAFWTGTMEDYFELYDAASDGATAALPDILIGGPVLTQDSADLLTAFLEHVEASGSRVTFLSSHAYPGGEGDSAETTFAVNDNEERVNVITSAGYDPATFPSFNTEWNSAYTGQGGNMTPNNVSMDNHVNAPFILKTVKLLADQNQGDMPPLSVFSYWTVSDVFGEYGGLVEGGSYIEQQGGTLPFGSVFGLINYQGVRKASFNAFKMLKLLGDEIVAVSGGSGDADGVDAIATVSEDGSEVAVIVYNYYSTINTSGSDSVTVNVENLPFAGQQIFVTHFRIDEQHSNPYSVWQAAGSPDNPSEDVWQAMREAQHLALLEPVTTITAESSYSATLDLPRQGAAMMLLSLERPVTGRDALMTIEAEDYDGQSGATRQDSDDESMGQAVALNDGGTLYFHQVDFSDAGVDGVQLRVNAQSDAMLELRADSQTGTLLGTCAIAATGGEWATQTCMLNATTGVHPLYALFGGGMRLNWMLFEGIESDDNGTGGAGGMTAGGTGGTEAGGGMTSDTGGMTTTGGVAGTAGTMPMGGTTAGTGVAGTSGGATMGGATATAGSTTVGATTATGGTTVTDPAVANGNTGGCGCRLASGGGAPLGHAALLGVAALGFLRRRRR